MNLQQIVSLIRQEIAKDNSLNRFRISPSNRHVHNNVDAPFVFIPYAVLGGVVLIDGTINPSAIGVTAGFLPKGWTSIKSATGVYSIVHNLNSTTYSVSVVPLGTNTAPQLTYTSTGFVVTFKDTATQAATDSAFMFTLFLAQNKSDTFSTYTVGTLQ